jgi:hypothetical protein
MSNEMELAARLRAIEARVRDLERLESPDRAARGMAAAVGMLQMFPGLRGLWPLGIYNASSEAIDRSGNGLSLTRGGTAVSDLADAGATLAPKTFFGDGASNLSRADEAAFDILGTEAYVRPSQNLRGLTIGMWVRLNAIGAVRVAMSKWASSNFSYTLSADNGSGNNTFFVSGNGTTSVGVTNSGSPLAAESWLFVCGRYRSEVPDVKVWMNEVSNTNATSIPSALFDGTAAFRIGQRADGTDGIGLNGGRGSLAFLCHAAVPDIFIDTYFQATAPLFGVSV